MMELHRYKMRYGDCIVCPPGDTGVVDRLTENMFRDGEEVFLDDMTAEELSGALQVPVTIVKSDGKAFLEAVLGLQGAELTKEGTARRTKQPYEHRP